MWIALLFTVCHTCTTHARTNLSPSMSNIPPSKTANIFKATKDSSGPADLDVSDLLELAGVISVRYTQIPSGNRHNYKVEEKRNLICYILTGDGQIEKGDRTVNLTSSDCFSFASSETANSFTLAAGQSSMTALVVSDILPDQEVSSVGFLIHVGLDLMTC